MRIQMKQSEIEAAIRQYISNQGINLAYKQVSVSFTASRKEKETIADVDIEDSIVNDAIQLLQSITGNESTDYFNDPAPPPAYPDPECDGVAQATETGPFNEVAPEPECDPPVKTSLFG